MAQRILIWLPSPLGDAVMATPVLQAFGGLYGSANITLLANGFTRQILSGSGFCGGWLEPERSFFKTVNKLRAGAFDTAILLKNSFGSALAIRLAGIRHRVGYARDGRSFLLTERIEPQREGSKFKAAAMIDYYLKIAERMGAKIESRRPQLAVEEKDAAALEAALPALNSCTEPIIILVPGGAFGPSKIWPIERYALLADELRERFGAKVIISIAPVRQEIEIAEAICSKSVSKPMHLGRTPLPGGPLKALFSRAALVITNDTGPRHIAIALGRKVISLFGPNNPQWTQTGHKQEIQIIGRAPCVPCDKPVCRANRHLCMESITVKEVMEAAEKLLSDDTQNN
ncbi:MAG: lipopolysaccharide heptosyltransferase II [Planctomycetaceae bacterium]|nr:lipopolysaccharide heptosyltransferase II [Planctomycetaceae bacterium]